MACCQIFVYTEFLYLGTFRMNNEGVFSGHRNFPLMIEHQNISSVIQEKLIFIIVKVLFMFRELVILYFGTIQINVV